MFKRLHKILSNNTKRYYSKDNVGGSALYKWNNDAIEHYDRLSILHSRCSNHNNHFCCVDSTVTKPNALIGTNNHTEVWDDEAIDYYNRLAILHSQYN